MQSLSRVLSPANPAWDYHVAPFRLPPYTRLMLADVDAGSDTPSFVSKVLKWRKETPTEGTCFHLRVIRVLTICTSERAVG